MSNYSYDYVIFDNETNEIIYGNYVNSDKKNYVKTKESSQDTTFGSVVYTYSTNTNLTLVIRQNSLPEFTNSSLRSIPYNDFTYIFFFIGEISVIIIFTYRLKNSLKVSKMYRKFRLIWGELQKNQIIANPT